MSIDGLEPFGDLDEEHGEDDGLDPTSPQLGAPESEESGMVGSAPTVLDPHPSGTGHEEGMDGREPVEITWRGAEPEWVGLHSEWRSMCTGPEMLARVVELVNSGSGRAEDDWALQIDLTKIPVENLREFNQLFREAASESDSASDQRLEVRTTKHLRAVWRGSWLLEITADGKWLSRVGRQAISEELSEVARLPEGTELNSRARVRLFNFIGGTRG